MRSILSPEARPVLDELAAHHALLAFDFDGTLAPFVADREDARIPEETRRLLRATALLYPCAVVSGRSRVDVAARLSSLPLAGIIGNHGAEAGYGPIDRTRRERLGRWWRVLVSELGHVPGLSFEDKIFSIAVHYRHASRRASARRRIIESATRLDGARVLRGHAVVNVLPADAPDKGSAIASLLERVGARPILYVGDDTSDENVFRSSHVGVGIRVGRTARSSAAWYLPAQRDVDALLRALINARTRHDGLGERWEGLARAVGGLSTRLDARPSADP